MHPIWTQINYWYRHNGNGVGAVRATLCVGIVELINVCNKVRLYTPLPICLFFTFFSLNIQSISSA